MAKFVLKTAVVTVDGDDISDHVSEVTIETERDEVDVTSMGSANREILAGLGDATITLTVFQDFASNEIDQNMYQHSIEDSPFEVTVKPTNATVSATNPEYSLPAALLFSYSPIAGAVGEASTTELVFRNAGPLGLVKAYT
jgi:hypothetical protein